MNDNDRLHDIEIKIGSSMRESASQSAPPFSGIAGRIAKGQPAESFEAFFEGDIPALPAQSIGRPSGSMRRSMKIMAGASAAALLLFIGGGVLLGAIIQGTFSGTKSDAVSADGSYYENCDSFADRTAEVCEETDKDCVSDSDLKESDLYDSSDTSK